MNSVEEVIKSLTEEKEDLLKILEASAILGKELKYNTRDTKLIIKELIGFIDHMIVKISEGEEC
ncbi:hypothetical protein JH67_02860 [Listeria monocytogenes]|nr:hypothetical protein [Listeria monocytogenes]